MKNKRKIILFSAAVALVFVVSFLITFFNNKNQVRVFELQNTQTATYFDSNGKYHEWKYSTEVKK